MHETNPLPLTDALAHWHEFYTLLGTASATLIGLLFVAATVAGGVFSTGRRAPLRVFLSASVVHFSGILAACLVVLIPQRSWLVFGLLILSCGIFGLVYYALSWRDSRRDGLSKAIAMDDTIWYLVLPVAGYLFEAASGIAIILRLDLGCELLAATMGVLLLIGIHNAWDITVWSAIRRRE
jgi:hypothetical protein